MCNGVTVQNCGGIAEVVFPGTHLFVFLSAVIRNTWSASLPLFEILESQVFAVQLYRVRYFHQRAAARREGWSSVQKTSLNCRMHPKISCQVICGKVVACQSGHMDLFEEEHLCIPIAGNFGDTLPIRSFSILAFSGFFQVWPQD